MAVLLSPLLLALAVLFHYAPTLQAASSFSKLAKNARIGIVGAGPAGLHMAYLLHNLGYTNLVVLDSTKGVGGRSWSVLDDDGLVHEMGTCYLSRDYSDLRRMAQRINYDLEEVNLPSAVIRAPAGSSQVQMSLPQFLFSRVVQVDPGLGPNPSLADVQNRTALAAERYLALRKRLFSHPAYFEFPLTEPSPDAMSRLNCTILEFLKANSLMALEPYFLFGMTSMGYGSPGDTSAIYGLMWMSPELLNDLVASRESSKLTMLRRGYLSLWKGLHENLAASRKSGSPVEFRFNSAVTRVTRGANKVMLEINKKTTETFDWLVWTPNIMKTFGSFTDLTSDERSVFGQLSARKFHTRLIRLPAPEPSVASEPVAYYIEPLDSPGQIGRLLAVRNTAKVMKGSASLAKGQSTLVAYYLSSYAEGGSDIKDPESITQDEKTLNGVGETLRAATFDYMPRFSVQQMAGGMMWQILRSLQGARQTWFAGHSLVFDAVKSVIKYNKMLLVTAFPDLEARLANM